MVELFTHIDSGQNGSVSYNELIIYIQTAQKEKTKLIKLE